MAVRGRELPRAAQHLLERQPVPPDELEAPGEGLEVALELAPPEALEGELPRTTTRRSVRGSTRRIVSTAAAGLVDRRHRTAVSSAPASTRWSAPASTSGVEGKRRSRDATAKRAAGPPIDTRRSGRPSAYRARR